MHTALERLTRRVQGFVGAWREESRGRRRSRKGHPGEREACVEHRHAKDQGAETKCLSVECRDKADASEVQKAAPDVLERGREESTVGRDEFASDCSDPRPCDVPEDDNTVEADDEQQQNSTDARKGQLTCSLDSDAGCDGGVGTTGPAEPEQRETRDVIPPSTNAGPYEPSPTISDVDAVVDIAEDTTPAPQTPVLAPEGDEAQGAADPTPILIVLASSAQGPLPEPEPESEPAAVLPLPTSLEPSSTTSQQQHTRTQHEPRVSQMHGWLRSLAEKDEEAFVADAWHEEDRVRGLGVMKA